jgi:hypothetical protein
MSCGSRKMMTAADCRKPTFARTAAVVAAEGIYILEEYIPLPQLRCPPQERVRHS